jgi:hypothetical protein
MGNEMSAEGVNQSLDQDFDLTKLDGSPVFAEQAVCTHAVSVMYPLYVQIPETSPKSESEEAKTIDEAEISRLLKMDSSTIDVKDTGMFKIAHSI